MVLKRLTKISEDMLVNMKRKFHFRLLCVLPILGVVVLYVRNYYYYYYYFSYFVILLQSVHYNGLKTFKSTRAITLLITPSYQTSLAQGLEIIYIWLLVNFLNIPFFFFVQVYRHGADFYDF